MLPNQDAIKLAAGQEAPGEALVLAVADGHGGAKYIRSDVGSALAVDVVVAAVKQFAAEHQRDGLEQIQTAARAFLPGDIVGRWEKAVRAHLQANPFKAEEWTGLESKEGPEARETVLGNPITAYGTTMLGAAIMGPYALYLQLGDGDILCVDVDGTVRKPVRKNTEMLGNATTSLAQLDPRMMALSLVKIEDPLSMIMVSTDGYSNSFLTESDFLQIGPDYLRVIKAEGLASIQEKLKGILENASKHGSGDDITLGIIKRAGDESKIKVSPVKRSPAPEKEQPPAAADRPVNKPADLPAEKTGNKSADRPAGKAGTGPAPKKGGRRTVAGLAVLAMAVMLVFVIATVILSGLLLGGYIFSHDKDSHAMSRADPQHTGVYDSADAVYIRSEVWNSSGHFRECSSPIVANGVIYFGDGANLTAVDVSTGEELWRYPVNNSVVGGLLAADGLIYFGSLDQSVYAVNTDGQLVWKLTDIGYQITAPVLSAGSLFVNSYNGTLYQLNPENGSVEKALNLSDSFLRTPTMDGKIAYTLDKNYHLYAVDTADGRVICNTTAPGSGNLADRMVPALSNGVLYYGDKDGILYAVRADTGDMLWSFTTNGSIETSPVVTDEAVYFGSLDGYLYAVDLDGNKKWSIDSHSVIRSDPSVAGDMIYFGNDDGYLYAVNTAGDIVCMFSAGDAIVTSPVIEDGKVYFITNGGVLYALDSSEQDTEDTEQDTVKAEEG